jgi:hypothetical protein
MVIEFIYRYEWSGEARGMRVVYVDGAVNVTDYNGTVHPLTYSGGVITGPGRLAETHREAIAGMIAYEIQSVQNMLATIGVAP